MKTVEVILASYNGGKYIKEQIISILMNFDTLNDYSCKLLISDDASTDSTVATIKEMQGDDDRVFLLDSNKKGGVKENFHFLMKNTSADYIFFSDQDDLWLPNKMRIFLERFSLLEKKTCGPMLVHSDLSVSDANLSPVNVSMFGYQKLNKTPDFSNLIVSNSITGCVMACNKSLINIAKNSDINNSIMHDWYLGLCASAFGVISYIDAPLILYRQHGNNQVGAKQFSILKLLFAGGGGQLHKARNSIHLTKLQSSIFLNDFHQQIDSHKSRLLKEYIESFDKGIFSRGRLFLRKGVRKNGIVRNTVFFLFYVLFK